MARPKGLPKTGGRAKGQTNKANADLKAYAAKFTKEAVDKAVEVMRTSDNPAAVIAAANMVLDRGHGKPKQEMDLKADVEHSFVARLPVVALREAWGKSQP